jgi:phosphoglycerate kinase
VSLLLPSDAVVVNELRPHAPHQTVGIAEVQADQMVVDIGPDSVRQFGEMLQRSRTVFWNGPMGVFEMPPFDQGTRAIAEAIAGLDAVTMVGGGETVAAVEQTSLAWRFTHVSTGGGASLEFLEGRTLPGVAALMQETE